MTKRIRVEAHSDETTARYIDALAEAKIESKLSIGRVQQLRDELMKMGADTPFVTSVLNDIENGFITIKNSAESVFGPTDEQ